MLTPDDVGGHRTTGSQGLPDEINKHQTQGIRKQSPQLNEYDDEYDDDTDDLRFHNTLKTKYSQMPDSRLTPGDRMYNFIKQKHSSYNIHLTITSKWLFKFNLWLTEIVID